MSDKVYESYGLKYGITKFPRPTHNGVVYFTQSQFDYLKANKCSREEFEYLWKMKKADWSFDFIPQEVKNEALKLANKYVPEILAIFRPPVVKSSEEVLDETNINLPESNVASDGRS